MYSGWKAFTIGRRVVRELLDSTAWSLENIDCRNQNLSQTSTQEHTDVDLTDSHISKYFFENVCQSFQRKSLFPRQFKAAAVSLLAQYKILVILFLVSHGGGALAIAGLWHAIENRKSLTSQLRPHYAHRAMPARLEGPLALVLGSRDLSATAQGLSQ